MKSRYPYLLLLLTGICYGMRMNAQGLYTSNALAPMHTETVGTGTTSPKKLTAASGFLSNYQFGSSSLPDSQYMAIPLVQNAGSVNGESKTPFACGVTLHPDVIECNNGVTHFNATDTYYGVTYSNSNAGNTYAWNISGGPFSFQGASSSSSQYPNMQLQTGHAYTVIIQFTTGGVTCSDTQQVFKNVTAADTIQNSHDTTVCYNSAPIPLSGKASPVTNTFAWTTTGSGTFSNPTSLSTTYTLSAGDKAGGVIKIYLTGTSTFNATGNCGSNSSIDSMSVNVYPNNTGTNTTQIICSNQTLSFTPTSTIAGSTYSWLSSVGAGSLTGNTASGTGKIIDSLVNLSNINDATVVYTITPYAFTPNNNTCTGTPFTLTVTAKPKPAITTTNNTATICTGSTTDIQFSSALPGVTYTWSSSVVSGTVTGKSSNAVPSATHIINDVLINNTNTNAIVRYYLTAISPSGCTKTDSTDVHVNGVPTVANAGPDQALCNVTNTLLAGNSPVLGTGSWAIVSGPSSVSFGSPSSPSSTVSGLIPGTYQLSWSITNGVCPVSKDTVVIVNANPTVAGTVSSNATVCSGSNSGTLTLSGYTGNIIRWESSTDGGTTWPTVIANTTATYNYSNLTTTTFFRAVVQSGACNAANASPAAITVSPATVAGTLSSDAVVCATSNSGTLTLSGYTGNIIRWESSINGGANWNAISNTTNTYSYTNLTVTALFRVVVQSGSCGPVNSNAITITVNPQTVAGTIASSTSVCATANNGTLLLSGNTGSILHWESSIDNGSTWNNIANTTNSLTYTNLTATTKYRAAVQSNPCSLLYTNIITITVLQAVTIANAGVDQVLCSTTSATLAANTPTSGTGTWTFVAGPSAVSFTNPNDPATTVNGLTTGVYQLAWTIVNGFCSPSQDTVQVTVNPQTVPGTLAASATVCATANSGTLSLTGYTSAVVRWESSTDGGATWNNIANTTNSLTYTNLSATTKYRAAVQSGVCPIQYSNVNTITVLQSVTVANAGVDQTLCSTTSALLAANTPTSGTGTWTFISGPSVVSFTNPNNPASTVNGLTTGVYQLAWTIANGFCTPSQDTVQITVNPQTVPGTLAASATVCATANSGTLSLTGYTSAVVRWESSTDGGATWNNIANTTNSLTYTNLSATTKYRAAVQSGVCPIQYSNVNTITVLQSVTVANAGVDQTLCSTTSALLAANTPTSGTGTWTFVAGPSTATFTNPNDPATTVNGLTTGVYQLAWTIANGFCSPSQDTVQVTVNPQTVPGTLAASATVCVTANSGTLSLTGYTSAVVRWESSTDGGATWNNIANTTNSLSYNNLSATTAYRAAVQSGVCPVQYSNINTITVSQSVTTANAGVDQVLCSTTSALLAANIPASGTGTWTFVAGPSTATFTNPNDPATTVNGLTTGVYQLAWNIANGFCSPSQDTVQVTVYPQTVPGTLAASATVCATANSGALSLTGYTSAVVRWESSTDGGATWNNIANTTNSLNYTNLTATTAYRAAVQSGVCPVQYSNVNTITVLQSVTTSNAGTDQTLCSTTSALLAANTPTSGTGTWTFVSGPSAVTFTNPNDHATTVSGLTTGVYQLAWTIANGFCTPSQDTVQITVNPQTVPGTLAAAATVCATANNGTLSLTGYTSTVVRWESSTDGGATWNNIANTTNSLNYTNLTATTAYRAAVQSGVCPVQYSNVNTITVLQSVTTANAGVDQVLCSTTSALLAANTPTSGTGTWTFVAGPSTATFTNPNDPATTINGLTTGVYQLAWTIANGFCTPSQDTVQVTVNPQTVPGTLAAAATVCATSNSGTLSLTGYTSAVVRWESSTDGGATWNNIANTTNSLSYNNLSATTAYRAAVQSGVCAIQYSNVNTITVLQSVTVANAGIDQVLCSTTSALLAANTPTSGTGTWTFVSGPSAVTFTNPNDHATTVSGLTTGVYQLAWTIANGFCTPSQDTVQVTINPQTVPGTLAAAATVCATSNSGTLSLTGYTSAVVRWESSTDGGATWNNIANTTNSLTYTNLSATTAYRAAVQSGVCPVQYSNVNTITVLQSVTTSNAGTDQTLCSTTSALLAANTPTSGTGTWTFVAGPSTATFTNPNDPATTVNGLTTGVYQLAWTIANGFCSPSQDTVQVTINPQTVPGTLAASATVCATANSGTLSLTGYTSAVVRWESSTDGGATWNSIANTTNSLNYNSLTATTAYRAAVQSGVCPVQYSNVNTITVLQSVTTSNAGTDQALCSTTSALLAANTPTSGTGTWTFITGPSAVAFTNPNDPATTVNGLTTGVYQFAWTIANGFCSPSQDTVQVIVYSQTVPGTLASDVTVCATSNSGTLSLTGYSSSVLRWESSVNNGATWNNVANTTSSLIYNNIGTNTQYRALVQNAVCPSLYSNVISVTVLQAATVANAGADEIIINGVSSTKLNGNIPSSGTGTWSQISGPTVLSFSNLHDPKATVGGLIFNPGTPPTDGIYELIWTISNGVCAVSQDTMQITVQPPTNPGAIGPDAVVCTSNNHGTLTLTGYLGTILQWESSIDNGVTWSVIASTVGTNQNTYVYNNLTTTTLFKALVQNGVGLPLYSGIAATVTVLELVTPADAGTDQSLCNTTTTILAGNSPTSGTGTWTFVSGPSTVTFSNAADPHSIVNGLTIGTYQFAWTITNGICANSQDSVQVTVYAPTVAGTLTADATVCATANSGTLSLTGFVSSVLNWEYSTDNGTSWNNIADTTGLFTYNNLVATTVYRTLVQNAVCPSLYSNNVTINVVQPVTIANAGSDQSLCNVTSAALAGNTPTSGTGVWAFVSGPSSVTFNNPNDPATTVNGLTAGTYQFVWTISNVLCADSKDSVLITVYAPTVAGTLTADATVCAAANSGTLSLTGFVSRVLNWEYSTDNGTSWNNIADTTGLFTYNNLVATTVYRTLVQNAVCPSLYSNNVTINVVQPVTIANAGADQSLCNVTSSALAGNTPTSGTGVWTLVAGPSAVSFTNANDPATTVNGLTAGTYQFVWTISNLICTDSKDSVLITVYAPTVAGTLTADATVCAAANSGTLSLTGFVSSVLNWEYSTDNGTSWNNIADTTGLFTYNNLVATTAYRTLVQNAVCPSLYSNNVTINVVQPVTIANAGADQALCNVTSALLAGNTPGSGTGTWTFVAGLSAVTFTNPNDPTTTVNGLTAGTYQFVWSISNLLCGDTKDSVQIVVYPATVSGTLAAADTFVCVSGNTGTIRLSGYTGIITQWEFSVDNGNSWSPISNTSDSLAYTNLLTTTQYRVSVQSGICNSVSSNIVTIHVDPISIGGNLIPLHDTTCATANTGILHLSAFTGTIQHWEYSVDSGSNWTIVNSTDTTYTYTNINTNTWYRVLIQSGSCSLAYSDTAKLIIDLPTVAGTISDNAVVCKDSNSGIIVLTGRTGKVIHWEVSADNGNTWNIISDTSDSLSYNNLTATSQYRALIQNGTCAILYSNSINIQVIEPVTIADAGPDQVLCNANSSAQLQANTPVSGAGIWSFVSGPSNISFSNAALPNTTVNGLKIGTYKFVWTISNGTCANSTDTMSVIIDDLIAGFDLTSINDCGKTTFLFTNTSKSAFGIQNSKWFSQGSDTVLTKNYSLSFTSEGVQRISLTTQSKTGCVNTLEAVYPVIIYEYPKANINAIADICKNQLLQVSSNVTSQDSVLYRLWNLGNGKRASDSTVTVQYINDGLYTVKLTVGTVNNCFDSAYKEISVHPIPEVTITNNPIVCRGDSAELVGSGALNYIWTNQDNEIICDGCQTAKVKPGYSTQYKVVGYSQYGCSNVKTTDIRVIQHLKMITTISDTLCMGQSKQLFAAGAASYTWYPETGLSNKNASSPIANPQSSTTYHVIGKDGFNCFVDTAEVKIAVGVPTPINIGKDTVITAGITYQLNAIPATPDIRKWIWKSPVELSCRNCPSPTVRISNDAEFTCTAINIYGCASTDTVSIKTLCGSTELFVPNAFSPDGDGINDLLIVQGKGIKMIKSFRIFNRWGEVVFEKTNFLPGDPAYAWDGKVRGKPAAMDVFVYMAEVICEKGLPSIFKGNVAIIK